MLKYEYLDPKNIEVYVYPPEDQKTIENEDDTRFLGDITKGLNDYQFFTTPKKYFHALWWVEDGDLEDLKEKLSELNGAL